MRRILISFLAFLFLPTTASLSANNIPPNYTRTGTYPIAVEHYDEQTNTYKSTVVYMTVLSPNTEKNLTNDEAIDGYDLLVDKGTVELLSDADLIKMADVHAWQLANGADVPINHVEIKLTDKANSTYSATFSTLKGTRLIIKIIEVDTMPIEASEIYLNNSINILEDNNWVIINLVFLLIILPIITMLTGFLLLQHYKRKTQRLLYEEWDRSTVI